jgi:hypothetical protein
LLVGFNYYISSCFINVVFVVTPDFGREYAENGLLLVEAVVGLDYFPLNYSFDRRSILNAHA